MLGVGGLQTAHRIGQPTVAALLSLLGHHMLCTLPPPNALGQLAFLGHPCTHAAVPRHLTYGPSLSTGPTWDSPSDASFLRPISLVSWLARQLLAYNSGSSLSENQNRPLCSEGKETQKAEVSHSRSVGGSFNKQRNLRTRLSRAPARGIDLHTRPPES